MSRGGWESNENARLILNQWTDNLAQVVQSMTDVKPVVHWDMGSGTVHAAFPESPEAVLWWEQPFHSATGTANDMPVWVATPRAVWEHAGTVTLQAAGLETVALEEVRNTWFEILGQSLGAMARSLGALLGREVTCDAGVERAPDPQLEDWASVTMRFPGVDLPPMAMALGPRLLAVLTAPPAEETPRPEPEPGPHRAGEPVPMRSRTMDLLLEVDLPVSISFGKTQLPLRDVLKLTTGSIVELNRGINDQVEILVNQCLIARGEVVVVEGNYGVRILQIANRQDRLRSIR
jgi:flagellar motor switch protein FliN/FliY